MRNAIVVIGVVISAALVSRVSLAACPGDCGNDGDVTVNELIQGVNIALGNAALNQCASFDTSGNLPGPTGSAPINVYVGSDPPFATTLSAGMLATPTVTPGPTPTPGPSGSQRIVYAAGLPSHIFISNVDGSGKIQLTNF